MRRDTFDMALFISLHPEFADAIISNIKSIELRRTKPNISSGHPVVLYASSPRKEVVGVATVSEVKADSPRRLWGKVKHSAAISRKQFDSYFQGTDVGYAIVLTNIVALGAPVSLSRLRKTWPDFQPPQTYRYVPLQELPFEI